MESARERGEIITFYSYKGGTGRSMALANIACLLSNQGLGPVLMVDWDLEAPGLHRYFRDSLTLSTRDGFDRDAAIESHEGLIDLFSALDLETRELGNEGEEEAARKTAKLVDSLNLDRYIMGTEIPGLRLMKSGRENDGYSSRVNKFKWEELFNRVPWLFEQFAERLAEEYRYVLIDSRTGLTDISGICTMLLPEKLVVVFTPNRQSFTGVKKLVEQATNYRRASDDLRPLLVFPLPSRIESGRPDLREIWRGGDKPLGIEGYQPLFQDLLKRVYGLHECDLNRYFDEIQIQQVADYAYGEEVAVLAEKLRTYQDRFSLTRSYAEFTTRLVGTSGPWQSLDKSKVDGSAASQGESLAELLRAVAKYVSRYPAAAGLVMAFALLAIVGFWLWRSSERDLAVARRDVLTAETELASASTNLKDVEEKLKVALSPALIQDLQDRNTSLSQQLDKATKEALDQREATRKQSQATIQSCLGEQKKIQNDLDSTRAQLLQTTGDLNKTKGDLNNTQLRLNKTESDLSNARSSWESARQSFQNCDFYRKKCESKSPK